MTQTQLNQDTYYGPVYPQTAAGPKPDNVICPDGSPILIQSGTSYTCVTKRQYQFLQAWISIIS